jgi:hypothetical protein
MSELAEREGVRTLGTGVSPDNGFAKHRVHFLPRVFNHFALLECFPVVAGLPRITLTDTRRSSAAPVATGW